MRVMSLRSHQGFTLIELLVAMTIFAVMAAAGWQVFGQLQKTRERVGVQAERLSELQQAYMHISRDLTQLVNRPVVTGANEEAALTLSAQKVSFTKLAGIDPRFNQKNAFERVTYELRDRKLIRLVQKNVGNDDEQVTPVVVLDKLDTVKFVALDPGKVDIWPSMDVLSQSVPSAPPLSAANPNGVGGATFPSQNSALRELPVGIELSFRDVSVDEGAVMQWRFALPAPAPRVNAPARPTESQSKQKKQPKKPDSE